MIGKSLILIGVVILLIGVLFHLSETHQNIQKWFSWFGNLPGDIKIIKENFRFYFPFTSMLLISVILTLIVNIIRKIF